MSDYYFAYHGPKNDGNFDYKAGYGLSLETKRNKVNVGDKVFVIQKLKKSSAFQFCGLFEVVGHYNDNENKYPYRLKLSDVSQFANFPVIDDKELSDILPRKSGGNNGWSNFKKHFCKQGASFENPLDHQVKMVLESLLNDEVILLDDLSGSFVSDVEKSLSLSPEERRSRLKKAAKKAGKIIVKTVAFKRNPDVVAEVLHRANGKCELCNQDAPFIRRCDKTPYLEVHHKIQLSDGGDDTVENAVALCPNCHRKQHYGY